MTTSTRMKEYTGAQISLIDLANQFGLDKKDLDVRLDWGRSVLPQIQSAQSFTDLKVTMKDEMAQADEPELFAAALLNVWDIAHGNPTGYYIEMDSASSGCQIMSVLARCVTGMMNTGILSTSVPDLYSAIYKLMLEEAPDLRELSRKQVKKATVPHIYASKKTPMTVFEDAYELFVNCYYAVVPRAEIIKNLLVGSWDEEAESYTWELPDLHTAHIKVTDKFKDVFNFRGKDINYIFEAIAPKKAGKLGTKALGARTIHSYDAFVLRELNERCDYHRPTLLRAKQALQAYRKGAVQSSINTELMEFQRVFFKFQVPSLAVVDSIVDGQLDGLDHNYAWRIIKLINKSLKHAPFSLRNIHDGFGSLPLCVNTVKKHYNQIMGDSYLGDWLPTIVEQLSGQDIRSGIEAPDMAIYRKILNSNYAIS